MSESSDGAARRFDHVSDQVVRMFSVVREERERLSQSPLEIAPQRREHQESGPLSS